MKANTSITMDEQILDKVRAVSKASGEGISAFMERAARRELMYLAGQAVTDWQRKRGIDVEDRALAELALDEAAVAAVRGGEAG
ncbi:ribbon-helix-helix protein, CopG family [Nocardia yamanashiensis]|uniref:ribbon-helix-helix protein, CopG family n=1 Tax=Nocardia yamanashiensis TaxID=209247 RepID=UPI001E450D54|nr:ribbon-helix-helix protein, CopG family [Nocardia yamanashiensis]UGT43917.1 ribbon-helix-helix protein, CopG family [Nocardia yamanashiensis]